MLHNWVSYNFRSGLDYVHSCLFIVSKLAKSVPVVTLTTLHATVHGVSRKNTHWGTIVIRIILLATCLWFYVFQVAIYSRKDLNIRGASTFLLAYAANNVKCRPFLKKYFKATIALPSDWIEVAEIYQVIPKQTIVFINFSCGFYCSKTWLRCGRKSEWWLHIDTIRVRYDTEQIEMGYRAHNIFIDAVVMIEGNTIFKPNSMIAMIEKLKFCW